MAKIVGKSSTSFKIFEIHEDEENHENIGKLEQSFSDLRTENRSFKMTRFPRRSKREDSLEATTPTTTPETVKVSPLVPNAPIKPPRASKKVVITPKRLQFMEEAESPSSMSSDIEFTIHRYQTRSTKKKISENLRSNNGKTKQQQSTGCNSKNNWSDVDKENNGSHANGRQNELPYRQSSKKMHPHKNSLKSSQNRLTRENDFAHFRI